MATKGYIPSGSQTEITGNDMSITAPAGWEYIGYDEDGNYAAAGGGTKVSCTCNDTGDCLPFVSSDIWGNETSGCSGVCKDCTMSTTSSDGAIGFKTGGYIDMDASVTFLPPGQNIPGLFPAMMDNSTIHAGLTAFLEDIYQGAPIPDLIIANDRIVPPAGHKIVVLNVYGRSGIFPIPDESVPPGSTSGNDANCDCDDGNCEKSTKSVGLYSIVSCKGDCQGTCTLTTSANTVTVNTAPSYNY